MRLSREMLWETEAVNEQRMPPSQTMNPPEIFRGTDCRWFYVD